MHVVLGDGKQVSLRTPMCATITASHGAASKHSSVRRLQQSAAEPCGHCEFCRWKDSCTAEWEASGTPQPGCEHQPQPDRQASGGRYQHAAPTCAVPDGNTHSQSAVRYIDSAARPGSLKWRVGYRKKPARDVAAYSLGAVLRGCPSPTPAISSSIWKATRFTRWGSNICSGLFIRRGRGTIHAYWAHNREDEKTGFRKLPSIS